MDEASLIVAKQRLAERDLYREARRRAANDDESQKRTAMETQGLQYHTFLPQKTAGYTSSVTSSVKGQCLQPVSSPQSHSQSIASQTDCLVLTR